MAQCMAMGQAAGTAAAAAAASSGEPRQIDVTALRDRLRLDGAILELKATAPAARPLTPTRRGPAGRPWAPRVRYAGVVDLAAPGGNEHRRSVRGA